MPSNNSTAMRHTLRHWVTAPAALGLMLTIAPAVAQIPVVAKTATQSPLPNWKVSDVCARDSVTGQCDLFEHRAAATVSGSWVFIPEDVRAKCLADSAKPAAQSWRLLSGCIETAMSQRTDRQAVLTARTPTEPVPPRKVVPVAPPEEKTEIKTPAIAPAEGPTPAAVPAVVTVPAAAASPAASEPPAPAAATATPPVTAAPTAAPAPALAPPAAPGPTEKKQ